MILNPSALLHEDTFLPPEGSEASSPLVLLLLLLLLCFAADAHRRQVALQLQCRPLQNCAPSVLLQEQSLPPECSKPSSPLVLLLLLCLLLLLLLLLCFAADAHRLQVALQLQCRPLQNCAPSVLLQEQSLPPECSKPSSPLVLLLLCLLLLLLLCFTADAHRLQVALQLLQCGPCRCLLFHLHCCKLRRQLST
jgi:hypothetical protein